ncbi:MAG: M23 family metallopeptidase [Sphingomicrobium sp.]
MTSLTAATGVLRKRDLFFHDGSHLRRIRLTAPVQALMALLLLVLVGWSGYATARLLTGATTSAIPADMVQLAAATELRARQIEQRQELLAAMLQGKNIDAALPGTTSLTPLPAEIAGKLSRAEDLNAIQTQATVRALDARYEASARELKRLGITPQRLSQGGPFEPVAGGDATFKALFNSWKKLDNLADGAIAVPSDKPIKTAVAFTSGFGIRSDPFQARAAMHPGIDLAGPMGTPIYATAEGTVLRAGFNNGGYGNLVELDHGKGITTRYGHMSAILVSAGQHIVRGQQIGRMGSTGRSTGSHLHYEVRIDGRAVNPIPFMKSNDYLLAMQQKGASHSMDAVALGGPQR